MASGAEQFLERVNEAANDVQSFANALADKIRAGGNIAIRTSNTAYGAAAGAKVGSQTPTDFPPALKYGAVAVGAYLLLKGRR